MAATGGTQHECQSPSTKHISGYTPTLPGTTVPSNSDPPALAFRTVDQGPHSFPGPTIDDKATIVAQYEPQQLVDSPLLQPIFTLTNDAYSHSHAVSRTMPPSIKRLDHPDQFLRGLGFDVGTFCFVVCWECTGQPIATIGAHKYVSPVFEAEAGLGSGQGGATFVRVTLPDKIGPDGEIWELKSLATEVGLQGRGLANYLMDLAEIEVVRRTAKKELWMVLTTMKEVNFSFYRRRQYAMDYENGYQKGYLGSETGFTVVHMSKRLL